MWTSSTSISLTFWWMICSEGRLIISDKSAKSFSLVIRFSIILNSSFLETNSGFRTKSNQRLWTWSHRLKGSVSFDTKNIFSLVVIWELNLIGAEKPLNQDGVGLLGIFSNEIVLTSSSITTIPDSISWPSFPIKPKRFGIMNGVLRLFWVNVAV